MSKDFNLCMLYNYYLFIFSIWIWEGEKGNKDRGIMLVGTANGKLTGSLDNHSEQKERERERERERDWRR